MEGFNKGTTWFNLLHAGLQCKEKQVEVFVFLTKSEES